MIAKLSLRAGAGIVERGVSWPYQETIRRSNKTPKKKQKLSTRRMCAKRHILTCWRGGPIIVLQWDFGKADWQIEVSTSPAVEPKPL